MLFASAGSATAIGSTSGGDAASISVSEGGETPSGAGIFRWLYEHVLPHKMASVGPLDFYNITMFQIIAIVLILVVFLHVRFALESGPEYKMGWIARVFSGFAMFIRDEMVIPLLGEEEGKKFLPYFLYLFFFIAFMNLLGLVPHGATATACVFVTGAMALVTLVMMIGGGMLEQGAAAFWKNLIPHGMPGWLVPVLFLVELIGLLVKPFALMIRLFANMLAGHLVVLSFMGLIFFFAEKIGRLAYAIAVPSVGLAIFIMIIEAFVALLQAYIFTYLSILFVGMCRHPEH